MDSLVLKALLILVIFINIKLSIANLNDTSTAIDTGSAKVLSRTKRYLIFPDGSSFQLVFCAQNMGYLQLNIIWFGNTAALAWELPADPNIFHLFKDKEYKYEAQKRQDVKHIVYFNEDGKIVSKIPYRRKPIVNPAFAKRSIVSNKYNLLRPLTKEELHERHKNRTYIHDLDKSSKEFHREGRKSFYTKLETFFEGLGLQGKPCVYRLLCEHSRSKNQQSSFLQEIMKATFTFPKSHEDQNLDYDIAHSAEGDCAKLYPGCNEIFLFGESVTM